VTPVTLTIPYPWANAWDGATRHYPWAEEWKRYFKPRPYVPMDFTGTRIEATERSGQPKSFIFEPDVSSWTVTPLPSWELPEHRRPIITSPPRCQYGVLLSKYHEEWCSGCGDWNVTGLPEVVSGEGSECNSELPTPTLAKIKTDGMTNYALIVKTAQEVLRRSGRLPAWFGSDRKDALVEQIIWEVETEQSKKRLTGKWLRKLVTRVTRRVVRLDWYEERWWVKDEDGEDVRRSKSILRIHDPQSEATSEMSETSEDDEVVTPEEMADKGEIMENTDTRYHDPRLENLNQLTQSQLHFITDYVENLRRGLPFSVAQRVQFHRLMRQCNVEPQKTVLRCRHKGRSDRRLPVDDPRPCRVINPVAYPPTSLHSQIEEGNRLL
jgi:hypothetical protein